MLKPNRLVAMAISGKLAETATHHPHQRHFGRASQPPISSSEPSELLDSLINGLRRLCELAFGPNDQVHDLAATAVSAWLQTVDRSVDADHSSARMRDHRRIAVRLLTAIALYLELCRRERNASAFGVIEASALSRLMSTCDGHVPPEAVARCPALRRLLSQYQSARPATGRDKRITAA